MLITFEEWLIYFSLLCSFVQALNELNLESRTRKKCMRMLYETCARHILFPTALRIELCDYPDGIVIYRGGYSDVLKREYQGQKVAVKTLHIYAASDLQKVIPVGCQSHSLFPALYLNADYKSCRCSARSLFYGRLFGIHTCCRS